MENWFTIEEIDSKTYAISEYKHWEETHCYLLIGKDKSLLVDSGLGVGNILDVVNGLTDLPVEVVTTHVHWDHIGGHKYFKNIAVYEAEKEWLNSKFPIPRNVVIENLLKELCEFPENFSIEEYKIYQGIPSRVLYDNDVIDLGNRYVQVIHTPGHSPGHICLYEKDRKYLYSGDLIYEGTLDVFYPSTSPYEFMMSIKRIQKFETQRILPGHHNLKVNTNLVDEIDRGLTSIHNAGMLIHGSGKYKFGNFSIHL